MAYCLYSVQGSNFLHLAVPQPRPELSFAGPYVLQAPLAQMPNVSSVLLTRDKHMHTSSAFFTDQLKNMTTEELYAYVQGMEQELGIPHKHQALPFDMNDDVLVEYVKEILVQKKIQVLECKIQQLDNISTRWQDLMNHLYAEEYRMHNKFEFERFKPFFFNLVKETQTCITSMKDQKGFEQSFFFGNKLVDSLHKINENLEITDKLETYTLNSRHNITRHWTDYYEAGINIFRSLRDLQTTQEEIIRELTLESVHFGEHTTIEPMLTTLIENVQTCVNMLLDTHVWNREQQWMFEEVEQSRKIDFWMLRSDRPIARFSKSLRALIEQMINLLIQQRRKELDTEAKDRHVWTRLLDTLKSFKFPVKIQHRHPLIERFGTEITFFVLARKSNWTVWMRANGINTKAVEKLAGLVTKMTEFCNFFIVILNGLNNDTDSWSKWTLKIRQLYFRAMANSNLFDNLCKIEYMGPRELCKYIDQKHKNLKISEVSVGTKYWNIQLLRRYAHDLLIAPFAHELETLINDDWGEFRRCVRAMEDQNNIPEANRHTLENHESQKPEILSYAKGLKPWPINQDLERMTRRQLEATVVQMLRDLSDLDRPLVVRKNLDAMTNNQLISYAEILLGDYKRKRQQIPKSMILSCCVGFESYTASKAAQNKWSDIDEVAIELQTTNNQRQPPQTLKLTICRMNPLGSHGQHEVDVRFSLLTSVLNSNESRRNVTQFMEVNFACENHERMPHCLLTVYDPVDEEEEKENSTNKTCYCIPSGKTKNHENDQNQKLSVFLQQCATKIGKPGSFGISTDTSTQMYRACDPILRKERIAY
jgi:hypothetical protein